MTELETLMLLLEFVDQTNFLHGQGDVKREYSIRLT